MEKLGLTGSSKHSTDNALRGLSAVLVDGGEVFVDNGAIHGKSRVEQNIKFLKTLAEVPNPRVIHAFWITLHRFEGGVQGYYGAMPFALHIDKEAGVGYKPLAQQVNGMEKAVKGQVSVADVPEEVRVRVGKFLQGLRADLWDHASDSFRKAFEDA